MPFVKGQRQLNTGRTHFNKGCIPWNKSDNYRICKTCESRFHSAPSNNRIFCSKKCYDTFQKGKGNSDSFKKWRESGGVPWNKGVPMSEETRQKVIKAKLKNPTRYWLGKQRPEQRKEVKSKWGDFRRQLRERTEYQQWIRFIFKRDDYTCQLCGARSGNGKGVHLNAHHIFEAKLYPEMILDTTFGITLCKECHYTTY